MDMGMSMESGASDIATRWSSREFCGPRAANFSGYEEQARLWSVAWTVMPNSAARSTKACNRSHSLWGKVESP